MNADELVDYWLPRKFSFDMADETVDVLRDLQSEIKALKEENAKMKTKLIGHGLVKALDAWAKKEETK